jgi:hypothetical protein
MNSTQLLGREFNKPVVSSVMAVLTTMTPDPRCRVSSLPCSVVLFGDSCIGDNRADFLLTNFHHIDTVSEITSKRANCSPTLALERAYSLAMCLPVPPSLSIPHAPLSEVWKAIQR